MTVLYGPTNVTVNDGYNVDGTDLTVLGVAPGDTVSFTIDHSLRDAASPRPSFDFGLIDLDDNSQLRWIDWQWSDVGRVETWVADQFRSVKLRIIGGGLCCSFGTAFGVSLSFTPAAGVHCAYGTEMQPSASYLFYLTPAVLDAWLGAIGLPELAPFLTGFWYGALDAREICDQLPERFTTLDLGLLITSPDYVRRFVWALAWPHLCRCKAGSPSPTPPPALAPALTTATPTVPTFSCSDLDVCATLVDMQRQLAAIQRVEQSNAQLLTLVQRYVLPFAYIRGAQHSGLTGEGQVAIPRSVGIQVDVTALAAQHSSRLGNPDYIWDVGWVAIEDANGFIDERRVTRVNSIWMPPRMAEATVVTWALRPDVTIDIAELYAEP